MKDLRNKLIRWGIILRWGLGGILLPLPIGASDSKSKVEFKENLYEEFYKESSNPLENLNKYEFREDLKYSSLENEEQ
ncbi:MAG: hypothetical protein KC516_01260 [Nanoarchaeota archaeon]|nr:hypothetical protein [Nanoarchaeota archaeon]